METYKKLKCIGTGNFGAVYLAKSVVNQNLFVLKQIDFNMMEEKEDKKRAHTELKLLLKFKHRHIIKYKELLIDNDRGRFCIVMEYAEGGDLFAVIRKQKGVPFVESLVISWFIQICLALQYIHYHNVLHRDIKSNNILLTKDSIIKVGDFGVSRILKSSEDLATTLIGTPYYFSPEICLHKPYNYKSDIWALGCVLFEMIALEYPFQANNIVDLVSLILDGKRKDIPYWCSPNVREIVTILLSYDPDKRPSTDEILAYPFLQKYLSIYANNYSSSKTISSSVPSSRTLKNTPEHNSDQLLLSHQYKEVRETPVPTPIKQVESSSNIEMNTVKSSISPKDVKKNVSFIPVPQVSKNSRPILQDSKSPINNKVEMNTTYIITEDSKKLNCYSKSPIHQ